MRSCAIESPSPMPRLLNEIVGWKSDLRASSLTPGPESCTSMAIRSIGRTRQNLPAVSRRFGHVLEQVHQNAFD